MEDETVTVVTIYPKKHDRWSLVALGVDLAACIAQEISNTLQTAAVYAIQHKLHKVEEERFEEIVR
jgi:hypothetical protein